MTSPGENLKDKLTEILFKAKGKNCTDEILAIFKSELKSLEHEIMKLPGRIKLVEGQSLITKEQVKTAIEKRIEGLSK